MTYDTLLGQARTMIRDAVYNLDYPDTDVSIEPAPKGFGDLSCNVAFLLAKSLRRRPADIAADISKSCQTEGFIESVQAHPAGYLNITIRWDTLAPLILRQSVGGNGTPVPEDAPRTTIEHTSVNPNKALHIGHVRNAVIGDALYRILTKTGHDVRVLNYIDDSGLQVADIVLGFANLGFDTEPPKGQKFDAYCGDHVYVQTTKMCEDDGSLKPVRRDILRDIEQGDTEYAQMAESLTRRVLAAQLQTCWKLGVTYDLLNYESQIVRSGLWHDVFEKLKKMGLARLESSGENAGCWVIGDMVLVRSNGTATYMAKDIPYAAWKLGLLPDPFAYGVYDSDMQERPLYQSTMEGDSKMDFSAERVITVVDSRQSRLQEMVASVVSKMGGGEYIHLSYEAVTLSASTAAGLGADARQTQMSGRRGLYVSADDVYDMLYKRVGAETIKRSPDTDPAVLADTSAALAAGTIRYEMLRQDLGRQIIFDIGRSTSLEGDTAAYIMYAHARACRLLEKAPRPPEFDAVMVLERDPERELLRLLAMYHSVLDEAARNLSPKAVAKYCRRLAVAFNSFYESAIIIGSGDAENSRLCLAESFRVVVSDALDVLGIVAVGRM